MPKERLWLAVHAPFQTLEEADDILRVNEGLKVVPNGGTGGLRSSDKLVSCYRPDLACRVVEEMVSEEGTQFFDVMMGELFMQSSERCGPQPVVAATECPQHVQRRQGWATPGQSRCERVRMTFGDRIHFYL